MKQHKVWIKKTGIILFWILIWEIIALAVANAIVLATPFQVIGYLKEHITDEVFWYSIGKSLGNILLGFFASYVIGILLGILSYLYKWIEELLKPLFSMIKATPVAAITVLLLLWFGAANLSVIICFLIVLPNVYEQMLVGLKNMNRQLLDMAKCFELSFLKKLFYIYRSETAPYLLGSIKVCVGLSFKSAVAAEVIATPLKTMGERLYFAKIHLDTPGLFAWTFVIVLLSVASEKILVRVAEKVLMGTGAKAKHVSGYGDCIAYDEKLEVHVPAPKGERDAECNEAYISCLRIEQISKSYDGKEILADVSHTLEKGSTTLLMGSSGRGKTTLLGILAGLVEADDGRIVYKAVMTADKAGKAAEKAKTAATETAASHCKRAIVFQDNVLCEEFSVLQNIEMVRRSKLTKTEFADLCKLLPTDCISQKVKLLSGGMRRRVQVARAMFSDAQVLFMDEPFGGLDVQTKEVCLDFIKKYQDGRILLVATHEADDVKALNGRVWKL